MIEWKKKNSIWNVESFTWNIEVDAIVFVSISLKGERERIDTLKKESLLLGK